MREAKHLVKGASKTLESNHNLNQPFFFLKGGYHGSQIKVEGLYLVVNFASSWFPPLPGISITGLRLLLLVLMATFVQQINDTIINNVNVLVMQILRLCSFITIKNI